MTVGTRSPGTRPPLPSRCRALVSGAHRHLSGVAISRTPLRRVAFLAPRILGVAAVAAALLDATRNTTVPGAMGGRAFSMVASASPGFVPGGGGSGSQSKPGNQAARNRRQQDTGTGVWVFAEPPKKVVPEPDFSGELTRIVKDTLGAGVEKEITAVDRITPIDRWFGWDQNIIASRSDNDPFVDSSDALSYVTMELMKPLGLEFLENPAEEGGGVMVGEVREGSSAYESNQVYPGFHLIQVDNTPVYGLSFEEAIQPIVESQGVVRLTFFKGDAAYFYGEFRPAAAWLAEFLESLRFGGNEDDDEQ